MQSLSSRPSRQPARPSPFHPKCALLRLFGKIDGARGLPPGAIYLVDGARGQGSEGVVDRYFKGCLASLVPMYTGFARLVPLEETKLPVWYRFDEVQLPVWYPPLRKIQLIHFLVVVCNIYNQSVLRLPRMTNNQFEGASRLLKKKKSHRACG